VLDYVVVHELCHLTHMNHSREFWNLVGFVMPEYKVHRTWLKLHGQELNIESHMKRLNLL
ncbi:MAG: M48 family metallopeptidase, partial [Acetatifactor sp.]|nr:M48 family metallopeptidase [Acetatifactor sp.]